MSTIFDYLYSINGFSLDNSGTGICVMPLPTATATGTCGAVGSCTMPLPTVLGTADWAPFGACTMPLPEAMATADGYRPAWGECAMPLPTVSAAGHQLIESMCVMPPAFAVGYTGATASSAALSPTVYALSGYNTSGAGNMILPSAQAEGWSFGLDTPLESTPTSASVVALLQQGSAILAAAVAKICAACTTDNAKVAAITRYVAAFTYVAETSDRWTAAVPTLERKYGDCEDGAILIQALLLAAGVDAGRVMTCFGTLTASDGTSDGHAWTIYRREPDEEWVPLEWTESDLTALASVADIKRMVDLTASYTAVTDILTASTFTTLSTATWLKRMTTLRADGSMTLPCPDSAGQTNITADGACIMPATVASGSTGSRAAMIAPSPTVTATSHVVLTGKGACTMSVPTVAATAGAQGSCSIPAPQVVALAGARCDSTMSPLSVAATGASRPLVRGVMTMGAMQVSAHALDGSIATSECIMQPLTCFASDIPTACAEGYCVAPRLHASGVAAICSTATSDLALPVPQVRGHATSPRAWSTGVLRYDPRRLAS